MILEFLGGAAFRALAGQVISAWTKWQDHRHEKEMLELQMQFDERRADLQIKQQELAAKLQIQTIDVQRDADVQREEASAFREAMAAAWRPTGVKWVDAWNSAVRPAFATLCLWLWLMALHANGWQLQVYDKELMGLVVGFFFADRQMKRAGK